MSTFAGLGPGFHAFLADLAAAQNRDWFHANKGRYEAAVKAPCLALIAAVNEALAARGVPLQGDPKRSLSRINRDVRFSADKSPYKTYAAATFTRVPGEMSPGLLYLHLSPGEAFAGLGFYAVEPDDLTRLRRAIADDPDGWLAVEAALAGAGSPLEAAEALKRLPRGFEAHAAAPVAAAIKLKAHVCKLRLDPARDLGPELPERVAAWAAGARPLLAFGWRALGVDAPAAQAA